MKKALLLSTACVLSAIMLYAQSPGGIGSPELWFRTVPVGNSLHDNYRWLDCSGDSTLLLGLNRNTEARLYTQERNLIKFLNFNPALDLSKGDLPKWSVLSRSSLTQSTVMGVFAPYAYVSEEVMFGIADGMGGGTLVTSDKVVKQGDSEPLDYGKEQGEDLVYNGKDSIPENIFKEHSVKVFAYYRAAPPVTSVWGSPNSILTFGTPYNSSDSRFGGPFNIDGFNNAAFKGYCPELLVYGRLLTPGERKRVESYLAMKYGVTLNASYLDGDGNLVWNREEAGAFHNRVTAISRNDAGDFLQPLSTTSYEEGAAYDSAVGNDSYHNSDPYGLSSENRLLVMGSEYGNPLPDKLTLLWGDDGKPLTTYTTPEDSLWHVMNRSWLVRTTIPTALDAEAPRWNGSGMTITPSGFLDNISTEGGTGGNALTPEFASNTGMIEFPCPTAHPTFDVGFTGADGKGCAYGFRIYSDGSVKPITDGAVAATTIATSVNGKDISVMLDKGNVYLRIDGVGAPERTLIIPIQSGNVTWRGIIAAEASATPLHLTSVRTNGATATGYMAELAHNRTTDKEFMPYSRNRTFLLIDPGCEGHYILDATAAHKCSPPDMLRGKTIFHNIAWDVDGSGSDMFTFAYFDGIAAEAEAFPTSCLGGTPQKDGAIEIRINTGTPIYKYTLTADSVAGMERGALASSGSFMEENRRIDNLATGTYLLDITQGGGSYLRGNGDSGSVYTSTVETFTEATMEWTVGSTGSDYVAGTVETNPKDKIRWGYDIRGDRAYFLVKSEPKPKPKDALTVKPGDILGLTIGGGQVRWYLNGKEVHTEKSGKIKPWRFCVKYGNGETHITGLTFNGRPASGFESEGAVITETPMTHTAAFTVHIGNGCDLSIPNGTEPRKPVITVRSDSENHPSGVTEESRLTVHAENSAELTFTARLDSDTLEPATLMVFDASGRLVFEGEMEGASVKTARFTVPVHGIYVAKAFTASGEHTRKIAAQ